MLLASENDQKVNLMIMMTDDLLKSQPLNAKDLIREISPLIDGSGGGQANFASAGGSNPNGIKEAILKFKNLIA